MCGHEPYVATTSQIMTGNDIIPVHMGRLGSTFAKESEVRRKRKFDVGNAGVSNPAITGIRAVIVMAVR